VRRIPDRASAACNDGRLAEGVRLVKKVQAATRLNRGLHCMVQIYRSGLHRRCDVRVCRGGRPKNLQRGATARFGGPTHSWDSQIQHRQDRSALR
jgi:hypothetical protein